MDEKRPRRRHNPHNPGPSHSMDQSQSDGERETEVEINFLQLFLPTDNPITFRIIQKLLDNTTTGNPSLSSSSREINSNPNLQIPSPFPREPETILNTLKNIPEIRDIIMAYLDLESILNLRLVNSTWTELLTNYLHRTQRVAPFKFEYNSSQEEFYNNTKSLRDFIFDCFLSERLEEKRKFIFPGVNFHFHGGDLDIFSTRLFFNAHGPYIKQLHIYPDPASPSQTHEDVLVDILVNKAPNVETLSLGKFPDVKWGQDQDLPPKFTLENLKNLHAGRGGSPCTALDMLAVARLPNLQNIFPLDDAYLSTFIELKKVHLVRDLRMRIDYVPLGLDILLEFARAEPRLKNFKWTMCRATESEKVPISEICKLIFTYSHLTLQSMVTCPLGYLVGVESLPVFERLRSLTFSSFQAYDAESEGQVLNNMLFYPHINLNDCFPALHTLVLGSDVEVVGADSLSYLAPHGGIEGRLVTVKVLQLNGFVTVDGLRSIFEIVPNATKLSLTDKHINRTMRSNDVHFLATIRYVFTNYKRIQELDIFFNWFNTLDLDSLFTGMSADRCELYRLETIIHPMPRLDFASICSLTKLKKLVVRFSNTDVGLTRPRIKLPSKVSAHYALAMFRGLRVKFKYHKNGGESSKEIESKVDMLYEFGVSVMIEHMPRLSQGREGRVVEEQDLQRRLHR